MTDISDIEPGIVLEYKSPEGRFERLKIVVGDEAGKLTKEEAVAEVKRWLDWNVK